MDRMAMWNMGAAGFPKWILSWLHIAGRAACWKRVEKRFLAVCIPCGSRLAHLMQTLPGTLEVLRNTGQGVAVLMEYACKEKSGE